MSVVGRPHGTRNGSAKGRYFSANLSPDAHTAYRLP
ncbi:unnamed protein product [Mycetohabitans rhizoxinica HKI 454]|uniref:Uncharacterized protein n=1 Tax=Mycetohabitans rhizoxinica (strain DSM 19002 / CIP 109453 / HKI 454) TaxID=882378 RepID=E5AKY3_MYCRK|nr:unnamed protein product [Mycetohabitans rhizoxinica HKI 454]